MMQISYYIHIRIRNGRVCVFFEPLIAFADDVKHSESEHYRTLQKKAYRALHKSQRQK